MARDWKKEAEKLQKEALEHKKKMETDPEYRKQSEKNRELYKKYLPGFGNDER